MGNRTWQVWRAVSFLVPRTKRVDLSHTRKSPGDLVKMQIPMLEVSKEAGSPPGPKPLVMSLSSVGHCGPNKELQGNGVEPVTNHVWRATMWNWECLRTTHEHEGVTNGLSTQQLLQLVCTVWILPNHFCRDAFSALSNLTVLCCNLASVCPSANFPWSLTQGTLLSFSALSSQAGCNHHFVLGPWPTAFP